MIVGEHSYSGIGVKVARRGILLRNNMIKNIEDKVNSNKKEKSSDEKELSKDEEFENKIKELINKHSKNLIKKTI